MAFLSMKEISRRNSAPSLTVRDGGLCYVNKAVTGEFDSVEAEICFESNRVRLRVGVGLDKALKDGTSFSIPKAAYQAVVDAGEKKKVMQLEKHSDGWWYASFSDKFGLKRNE